MTTFQKAIIALIILLLVWLFLFNRYSIVGSGQQTAYKLDRFTGETYALHGSKSLRTTVKLPLTFDDISKKDL